MPSLRKSGIPMPEAMRSCGCLHLQFLAYNEDVAEPLSIGQTTYARGARLRGRDACGHDARHDAWVGHQQRGVLILNHQPSRTSVRSGGSRAMAMITKTSMLWECRALIPIRIVIGMLQLAKVLHRLSKNAHRLRFCPKLWPLCCDRAKMLLQGLVVGSREGLRWNIR